MYRVDTLQHQKDDNAQEWLTPVFACLASAPPTSSSSKDDDKGGLFLTTGRKNTSIILDKDKSVSRDHLHFHLLSTNEKQEHSLSGSDTDDDNQIAAGAGVATSHEEKQACNQSPLGLALVVKNLGRFGSAVVALTNDALTQTSDNNGQNADKQDNKADGGDSATDAGGSDTEDESQQQKEASQKKLLAQGFLPELPESKWFDETQEIVSFLTKTKSNKTKPQKILTATRLMANEECVIPGNATRILVQVGQLGSILVLTRMDIQLCKSSVPKKEEEIWRKQVYAIGARFVDEENLADFFEQHAKMKSATTPENGSSILKSILKDHPPTTYMVAKKREVSGKQLAAWNVGIPFVTLDFLHTLLARKKPQDSWPMVQEFDPPFKSSNADIDNNFWKDLSPQKNLWKSCIFLNTSDKHKDSELFVKTAGGAVVQVYKMKDKDAKAQIQQLLDDPKTKDGLFAISNSSRKAIVAWIKKQGIPHFKLAKITIALCNQQRLKDEATGKEIGGTDPEPEEPEVTKEKPATTSDDDTDVGSNGAKHHEEEATNKSTRKTQSSGQRTKRKYNDSDDDDDNEFAITPAEKKRSGASPAKKRVRESHTTTNASQSQRAMEILPSVQEDKSMHLDDTVEPESGAGAKPREKEHEKKTKQQPSSSRPKTDKLKAMDGWIAVVPKNLKRRKSRDEAIEFEEGEPVPDAEAETCIISGLVSRPYDPDRQKNRNQVGRFSGYQSSQVGIKEKSKIDFRRFCKGNILVTSPDSRIRMQSVLPKESQRLKELEDQQREIDEQQRLADELFNFGGGGTQSRIKATKRRRHV